MPADRSYPVLGEIVSAVDTQLNEVAFVSLGTAFVLTEHGCDDPDFRQKWLPVLHAARIAAPEKRAKIWDYATMEDWRGGHPREGDGGMRFQWSEKLRHSGVDSPSLLAIHQRLCGATKSLWYYNPWLLVVQLLFAGRVAIIEGPKDSGKTEMACSLMEWAFEIDDEFRLKGRDSFLYQATKRFYHGRDPDESRGLNAVDLGLYWSKGLRVVANINIFEDSPYRDRIDVASRMSDFVRIELRNRLDGYFTIEFGDELGLGFSKTRAMSNANKSQVDKGRYSRKWNLSSVLMTQDMVRDFDQRLYDPKAKDGARTIIEKREPTKAIVTVADVPIYRAALIEDIPRTRIHFQSMAAASFKPDIDIQEMIEDVEEHRLASHGTAKEWTVDDEAKAYIAYCAFHQKVNRDVAVKSSPRQRQAVMNLLSTKNEETGENYTYEEVAELRSMSVQTVKEIEKMEKRRTEAPVVVVPERRVRGAGSSAPEPKPATEPTAPTPAPPTEAAPASPPSPVEPVAPAAPPSEAGVEIEIPPDLRNPNHPSIRALMAGPDNPETHKPWTLEEAQLRIAKRRASTAIPAAAV